jgi:hypothetical protein
MTSLSFHKLRSGPCYENCLANKEMSISSSAHHIEKCVDQINEVHNTDEQIKILSGAYSHSVDYEDDRRRHISETFVNEKFTYRYTAIICSFYKNLLTRKKHTLSRSVGCRYGALYSFTLT